MMIVVRHMESICLDDEFAFRGSMIEVLDVGWV